MTPSCLPKPSICASAFDQFNGEIKYLKDHDDEIYRSWSRRVRGQDKDFGVQQMWLESLFCPSHLGDPGPLPQFIAL